MIVLVTDAYDGKKVGDIFILFVKFLIIYINFIMWYIIQVYLFRDHIYLIILLLAWTRDFT